MHSYKVIPLLLALAISCGDETPRPEPVIPDPPAPSLGSGCDILSMKIKAGDFDLRTEIDTENWGVTIYCYEEDEEFLSEATCELELSEGARVEPDPSVARNYNRKLTFVVTAADGSEAIYVVKKQVLERPSRPRKPVVMWIDSENSMFTLDTKEKIADAVMHAYNCGFSGIVMDIKSPASGDVLYRSDFLGYCPRLKKTDVPQDFDMLQELIDRCRERGMTISASVSIMTMPRPATEKGQAYFNENLASSLAKCYLPEVGIIDQKDDPSKAYDFLNPSSPKVHDYVIRMVTELATKYDLDGIALDYCRYPDMFSDFSDVSRAAFEEYIGAPVENFPEDIMVFPGTEKGQYAMGKLFKQWIKWRASVIQGYVRDCRDAIKAVNPSIKLEYWSEAWWWDSWMKGQNWASSKAGKPSGNAWAADDYMDTAFAEYLDIYHLGAYVSKVYGLGELYTIEFLLNYGKQRNAGACTLYASFGAYNANLNWTDATEFCYMNAEGVMIFELGSVRNRWGVYKKAIWKAMRKMGEYDD